MLFHEEEKDTILTLSNDKGHHFSPVIITFPEGDSYVCTFNTSWESDNGLDDDDPAFDEYWEEWYDVTEVLAQGPNLEFATSPDGKKSPILLLTYKHFPMSVILEDGTIIYPAAK